MAQRPQGGHEQLRAHLQQQRGVGREWMAHLKRNVNRRPNLRAQVNRQQPLNRGNLNALAQRGQYVPENVRDQFDDLIDMAREQSIKLRGQKEEDDSLFS